MKRYLKVNNEWIDTLLEHKEYGRIYYVINGVVFYLWDETLVEYRVGPLESETDTLSDEK